MSYQHYENMLKGEIIILIVTTPDWDRANPGANFGVAAQRARRFRLLTLFPTGFSGEDSTIRCLTKKHE